MWKVLCHSVRGSSHVRGELPCQDCCSAAEVPLADQRVLLLVCADGAGSAEHSEIGARIACQALLETLSDWLARRGAPALALESQAVEWVRPVHERLCAEAAARGVDASQLACTLLFAVIGARGAAFAQIGDGAIVARSGDDYEPLLWPRSGEYANTTFFVTDPRFAEHLRCVWCAVPPLEVALLTDGLQGLALDFGRRQAHGPFFAPMFQALAQSAAPEALVRPLVDFLESGAVVERTDDDKTLILATRAES